MAQEMGQVDDIKDSNMANYGSKEHHELKQDAAKHEKAWRKAGDKAGLQIWRIENFQVKKWSTARYGEFYRGDSYILLNTLIDSQTGKKTYQLFFWLGSETTQDEAGTAAYKTVELSDYLEEICNAHVTQYREIMGNETKKFSNLFPKMTILDGGIDSGFRKVKDSSLHGGLNKFTPKLLHVCGYKRKVRVYQVKVETTNLNNNDSFVLDCGLKIFQFNGDKSSAWEKRKANAIVDELQALRLGKVEKTFIIDGLNDPSDDKIILEFWSYFKDTNGQKPINIKDHSIDNDDYDEKTVTSPKTTEHSLHHISDASGVMEIKEVDRGISLDLNKLDHDDAFILDAYKNIFVWIGKGSNKAEKREAFNYATRYLKEQGRNDKIPIAAVKDGHEPKEFWDAMNGKGKFAF